MKNTHQCKETTERLRTTATTEFHDICLANSDTVARHYTTLAQHLEAW